ncbi:MAG: NAD(P)/FAD-dependent oxidoreductase [Ignavibacteria bacterium]|nr:NAD(P)/FAD-dependent oxidoreductase [Ignavibacteria bacterium]
MRSYDAIIIGAGAAGLFCAFQAAAWGKRVAVVEHNEKPGKKIRISGGGRCNFTNRVVTHQNFLSDNPDFARSALARYTPDDFIALLEAYNVLWHEKTLGQLFCDDSAQQIIDMLISECAKNAVDIHYGIQVQSVLFSNTFNLATSAGEYQTEQLVVATGGLSIPTLGASDLGYRIAKHFGHNVIDPRPALVPLTFSLSSWKNFQGISGVSTEAIVNTAAVSFRENILFTHRGLSGPAILQISSYARSHEDFSIDLLPNVRTEDLARDFPSEKRHLATLLRGHLPQRLVEVWEDDRLHVPINEVPRAQTEAALCGMHSWTLKFEGNEGFAKAEVTSGGVDTRELSSKSMESKHQKGLYFIGEVVDVTGWLGGYNFQWAWSSGFAAGSNIRA